MTRFLADENVPRLVVERLRSAGFDVKSIGGRDAGASDSEVLSIAVDEGRVVITEDRDFGEMIVRQRARVSGVLLLELDRLSNMAEADRVTSVVSANDERFSGHLVVIEPGRIRVRPLAP